jgi:hypothetical protein
MGDRCIGRDAQIGRLYGNENPNRRQKRTMVFRHIRRHHQPIKRYFTIQIRKIHADFAWQTRFHDHIIRNNDEYKHIENYIINNPFNWKDDKFCKDDTAF